MAHKKKPHMKEKKKDSHHSGHHHKDMEADKKLFGSMMKKSMKGCARGK